MDNDNEEAFLHGKSIQAGSAWAGVGAYTGGLAL